MNKNSSERTGGYFFFDTTIFVWQNHSFLSYSYSFPCDYTDQLITTIKFFLNDYFYTARKTKSIAIYSHQKLKILGYVTKVFSDQEEIFTFIILLRFRSANDITHNKSAEVVWRPISPHLNLNNHLYECSLMAWNGNECFAIRFAFILIIRHERSCKMYGYRQATSL